jgi:hypothetical protein
MLPDDLLRQFSAKFVNNSPVNFIKMPWRVDFASIGYLKIMWSISLFVEGEQKPLVLQE